MTTKKIEEYAYRIYKDLHKFDNKKGKPTSFNNFCKNKWQDNNTKEYYCSLIINELLNSVEDVIYLELDKSKYASIIKVIRQIKRIMLEDTTK